MTTSDPGGQGRVTGVWGARAYAWSGEERPRAAGFSLDVSGRTRVLGFRAGPSAAGPAGAGEADALAHRRAPRAQGRTRLVVAVVAILGGRDAGQPPARA
jgi:hypothetical protein